MKNNKIKQLMERGLSHKLLSTMNEGQINQLHKMMVGEQVKATTMVSSKNPNASQIAKDLNDKGINVTMTEMGEDADLDDSAEKESGFDPYAGNSVGNDDGPSSDDGFGGGNDGMGMMEEKNSSKAFAICHSQVGPKKSRKWERCVREIKKQLKEGKNPYLPIMEAALAKMVEKHISPKMTKSELINTLSEQGIITRPFKNSMIGFVDETKMDKSNKNTYVSKKETMEQGTKTA